MRATEIKIEFPGVDDAEGAECAESLLSELKQDPALIDSLDRERTVIARGEREAMDFGATLIAVLGTPAIIVLAHTLKSWLERTGTSKIALNGILIDNVRSADIASIVAALSGQPQGTVEAAQPQNTTEPDQAQDSKVS